MDGEGHKTLPRVVIVSGTFPEMSCGVAGHVRLTAERTAALGLYEICVLTSRDGRVKPELAQGYTIRAEVENWGFFHAERICEQITSLKPDMVHIQVPTMRYAGWRACVMSRVAKILNTRNPAVRLVVMLHDIAVGHPWFRRKYRGLLQAADAVMVSNCRDEQAVRDQGCPAEKIYRAPVTSHFPLHRREERTRAECRRRMGLPQNGFCAAYFGYVHPARNVNVLLRAIQILRTAGKDVHALILGGAAKGSEKYYRLCKKQAENLGIGDRVTWTGYASPDQVADGMGAADVFVSLPERGADLRNTSILAGMLAELPVVTTENPRYYTDKELAGMGVHITPAKDPHAVARTIQNVLEKPPSPQALRRLAECLQPEKIWDQHIQTTIRAYQNNPPLRFEPIRI